MNLIQWLQTLRPDAKVWTESPSPSMQLGSTQKEILKAGSKGLPFSFWGFMATQNCKMDRTKWAGCMYPSQDSSNWQYPLTNDGEDSHWKHVIGWIPIIYRCCRGPIWRGLPDCTPWLLLFSHRFWSNLPSYCVPSNFIQEFEFNPPFYHSSFVFCSHIYYIESWWIMRR